MSLCPKAAMPCPTVAKPEYALTDLAPKCRLKDSEAPDPLPDAVRQSGADHG
jgi:hypothetical protein